ncbi:MAG: hypothetical protein M3160_09795 [Candidatus Eremiobacteraeota bacterium]|nr:hypothetical protein [Candidatus Eremiobacteraeota bacterium]
MQKAPSQTLPRDLPQRLAHALDGQLLLNGVSSEEAIERVIELRARARGEKDFGTSDRLRDVLETCGVTVNDSKDGTTWSIAD